MGWYGTAYLLTNCAFQLVFGKLYKFLPVKATFLISLLLFEAGSALCGAAPNSIALIFGRVISGLGAGGVLPGVVSLFLLKISIAIQFILFIIFAPDGLTPYLRSLSLSTQFHYTSGPSTKASLAPYLVLLQYSDLPWVALSPHTLPGDGAFTSTVSASGKA